MHHNNGILLPHDQARPNQALDQTQLSEEEAALFPKVMAIYQQKYMLPTDPMDDPSASSTSNPRDEAVLTQYALEIRLSNFDTSMQNQKEDCFSQMRHIFDKLIRAFLRANTNAQDFAQGVIQLIKPLLTKLNDNSIREVEFIYKMINMLLCESILFNASSRRN
jgi:hypothetical protein